jgi:hypothetical protein
VSFKQDPTHAKRSCSIKITKEETKAISTAARFSRLNQWGAKIKIYVVLKWVFDLRGNRVGEWYF